jgi:hypothetical protein
MDVQHIAAPEAGKDYPRNWNEFLDWFSSEEACLAYLEGLRWPQRYVCPSCGAAGEPYRSSRSRLMCRSCSHQCTVTAGTIFVSGWPPHLEVARLAEDDGVHLTCEVDTYALQGRDAPAPQR